MPKEIPNQSCLMARLTISAIQKATYDPNCWKEEIVHRAVLITGLSVLLSSTKILKSDLEKIKRNF